MLPKLVRLVVLLAFVSRAAYADRIDQLTKMLSSSSDKARLSAVVSLARLGDDRTLKPLVTALHDPNAQVRATAATALGHLQHKAALPLLRSVAVDDTDETVRTKAREATLAIAKANGLPDGLPNGAPADHAAGSSTVATIQGRRMSGFGRAPHAVEDKPDLYVQVKSSSDDSPGKADKATRKVNAEVAKQVLVDLFKQAPQVTMVATEAQRWELEPRHLDVSVIRLDVEQSGGIIEVSADLRLAISDDTGKMLSFCSGGAKVQIPKKSFDLRYLPNLRKEALENAMKGMFDKLLEHLRQTTQS
jgi:hypothetical protein